MAQISDSDFERIQNGGFYGEAANNGIMLHLKEEARNRIKQLLTKMRMSDVPKSVLIVIILLCIVAGLLGYLLHAQRSTLALFRAGAYQSLLAESIAGENVQTPSSPQAPQLETAPEATLQNTGRVYIHVDGAVKNPGVYLLNEGQRAQDAIEAAGGLTQEANTESLNLAAPVIDGTKLFVPFISQPDSLASPVAQTQSPYISTYAPAQSNTGLVNINTASQAELQQLPGVGEMTAKAIIQDRQEHGNYSSLEDLMRVTGIGEKKFSRISSLICI